jgi:hypothetical protein
MGGGGGLGGGTGEEAPVLAVESAVAAPWLVDVSHAAMCVGMAFMLVLMT